MERTPGSLVWEVEGPVKWECMTISAAGQFPREAKAKARLKLMC